MILESSLVISIVGIENHLNIQSFVSVYCVGVYRGGHFCIEVTVTMGGHGYSVTIVREQRSDF